MVTKDSGREGHSAVFVELLLGGAVRSYRADETQCVYTDVVKIPEDEGVPQGSAVDPVLFAIFMNNIRRIWLQLESSFMQTAYFTRLAHLWIRLSRGFLSAAAGITVPSKVGS